MDAPQLRVVAIEQYERDVQLRLPFRFGVVTLTAAPQAFVRARVRLADGREGSGVAAELLAPKWFDKNLALTNEDNFQQLRDAIAIAARAYTSDATARTAFGHYAAHYSSHIDACARRGLNPLVACFGPALIDRAVLDAVCRLLGMSFFDAMRGNVAGMAVSALTPDLQGFDLPRFLAGLSLPSALDARHTVGLVDPIVAADVKEWRNDGLPETLEQVVEAYGLRYFKLKVGGKLDEDLDRLTRIAAVLDRLDDPYAATLDGNEQYDDIDGVAELWRRVGELPKLQRLRTSTLFVEQPIGRAIALSRSVSSLAAATPLLIDESDAELSAFPRGRELGYTGVSSKACKGFYKSVLNAARCAHWNAGGTKRYFMSAEDLTCQAGVAVQQDLALVALLGLGHVERNGHHYVNGMAGVDGVEQASFLRAHPDLYERNGGVVRVRIARGKLAIGSLACAGFGVAAEPTWAAMRQVLTIGEGT
jgi:L-alanine-DL-glutamate epimerase-like enolase superfamily enzyme